MPIAEGTALALGAGVNALGSLLGFSSNKSANSQNLTIARETNAMNRELFNRQLAFQEDMFNKTNAYNLPKNQVQRLLDAGINPAFVMGNGSMSQASALSSPGAPSMQGATMRPYDFGALSGSFNQGISAMMSASQSRKLDAETQRINSLRPHEIAMLEHQARGQGYQADLARTELIYQQAINGQKISAAFGQNRLLNAQIKAQNEQTLGYQLQNRLAEVQLAYAPKLNEAQLHQYYSTISQIKANINLINANTSYTLAQKANMIQDTIGKIIDNGMKGFDFEIKKKTKDAAVDTFLNNADESYYNKGVAAKFFYGGEVGKLLPVHGFLENDKYNRRIFYGERPFRSR